MTETEVFTERSRDRIKNNKILPFRFFQAYKALEGNRGMRSRPPKALVDWLGDAIDIAASNLPDELDDTFAAVDLSGSMYNRLSSESTLENVEIGALCGSMLMQRGAPVGGFGSDFERITAHHDTPTLERVDKIMATGDRVGNATNAWKALDHLTERGETYDRMVVFTDEQVWDSTRGSFGFGSRQHGRTLKAALDDHHDQVNADLALYIINLESYGDLSTPEGYPNVRRISGWSENVFDFIEYAEHPDAALDAVRAVEP